MTATRTPSPSADAGFTLVELLMSMLVMTVGLLGLLQSVNVAYEHTLRTRVREQAVAVGEEQMLRLRALSLNELSDPAFRPVTTATRRVAGTPRSYTVTREAATMKDTRTMQVTVGWTFKGEALRHVVYSLKKL